MAWWIAAALGAYFVKGLCGFGNTLIFTTVLSFGNSNVNISPVDLLIGMPSNAIMTYKERKSIDLRVCAPLIALVLAGSAPGMLLLKYAQARAIKIVFGAVIIAVALNMLFERPQPQKAQSKLATLLVGLVSGVLSGMFGVTALLCAHVSEVSEDSHAFKGNMSLIFLCENLFRAAMYILLGIITPSSAKTAATLLPFMLAGLFAGVRASRALNEAAAKKVVVIMLVISGAALIINNI